MWFLDGIVAVFFILLGVVGLFGDTMRDHCTTYSAGDVKTSSVLALALIYAGVRLGYLSVIKPLGA